MKKTRPNMGLQHTVQDVNEGSLNKEHDPEKWKPVFPRDKRGTRLRGDHAQNKELEHDPEKHAPHLDSGVETGFPSR